MGGGRGGRRGSNQLLPVSLTLSGVMGAFILLAAGCVREVKAIESKCGACLIMADELRSRLAKEKPRNHLDMRNRLNSKGEREGRLIDYKVSELRAVELLDDLCNQVDSYSIASKDGKRGWSKTNEATKTSERLKLIAEEQGKELKRWCFGVMAEQEDELADRLRTGELNVDVDIDALLCQSLTSNCHRKSMTSIKERIFGKKTKDGGEGDLEVNEEKNGSSGSGGGREEESTQASSLDSMSSSHNEESVNSEL